MSIDKFGRSLDHLSAVDSHSSITAQGFPKTKDGDYDIQAMKLRNVASPLHPQDSANKEYVDSLISTLQQKHGVLKDDIIQFKSKMEADSGSIRLDIAMLDSRTKAMDETVGKIPQSIDTKITLKLDEKLKDVWDTVNRLEGNIEELQISRRNYPDDSTSQMGADIDYVKLEIKDTKNLLTNEINKLAEKLSQNDRKMDNSLKLEDIGKKLHSKLSASIEKAIELKSLELRGMIDKIDKRVTDETNHYNSSYDSIDQKLTKLDRLFRNHKHNYDLLEDSVNQISVEVRKLVANSGVI